MGECRCVTGLSGCEDEGKRAVSVVGGEVDLRGQSATGASEGMVLRLAIWSPF